MEKSVPLIIFGGDCRSFDEALLTLKSVHEIRVYIYTIIKRIYVAIAFYMIESSTSTLS